jgi:hypothetical protein
MPVQQPPPSFMNVRVQLNRRGEWEIALPDRGDPVKCKSLPEARTVAHQCAAQMDPCEIIIYDAYYRVLYRERPTSAVV